MKRLSNSIADLRTHYEVVVVGSGYGGGIAASRMARAGRRVCVLERGRELHPGEYPNTLRAALPMTQSDLPQGHVGSPTGLYDFRANTDINVFVGCGLGGTSLVNANVSLRANSRVFEDPRWPRALRGDVHGLLEDGYRRAEEMLKPTPYPNVLPELPKLAALRDSAAHLKANFYLPPINVTFKDGINHVGVHQQACKLCGDCVSGCNYAAKNTVLMNYLPDAKNHGAGIFTGVSVRSVHRTDGRWVVRYKLLDSGRDSFNAPTMFTTADIVVLAAGTLGSTEILLRSRDAGLALSDRLGYGFTGNGDVLGFGYNNDRVINGIGFGRRSPGKMAPVGPCITGIIDMRDDARLEDGMVIEEGAVPGGLSRFLPHVLAAAAALVGRDTDAGAADFVREKLRVWHSLVRGSYHGATRNTQVFLVMAHDDAGGRMHLRDDRLRVDWPGVGAQPVFTVVNERLKEATRRLGGTYVKNPSWTKLASHNLTTVHPLGGCVMAEGAEGGVVNHKGQVFSGDRGAEVHEGLYVADGSVIPRSLGVNPLLTISALAERTCALIARDRGWQISYRLPSTPTDSHQAPKVGIEFTETMRGFLSTTERGDYQRAFEQGKRDGSSFEFTLTVMSDDLDRMLESEEHEARMVGSVTAPALSPTPLTVTDGRFNLFVRVPERAAMRQMRYRMQLNTEEGAVYHFEGFKDLHDDPGFDVWSDTTTLYITVHDGGTSEAPVLGRGILRIEPMDFRRQMTTMRVSNARNRRERMKATSRFGRFFARSLYETYGPGAAKRGSKGHDGPVR